MVEFLDHETSDIMSSSACYLVLTQWRLFISEANKVHHRSRVATDCTIWDRHACPHDTALRHN